MSKSNWAACTLLFLGCATAERVAPAPVVLPEDGATTIYADLHPKVRQLTWQATEAFYRDDWRVLTDTAQGLEKAASLLKTAKDPSPRLQPMLVAKCDELSRESGQLREASQAAAIDRISAHLQKITNIVRELRPDQSLP